jgi:hypothetical protein
MFLNLSAISSAPSLPAMLLAAFLIDVNGDIRRSAKGRLRAAKAHDGPDPIDLPKTTIFFYLNFISLIMKS